MWGKYGAKEKKMNSPNSLYRWAVEVRDIRHAGKTIPLNVRLQNATGDPEEAFCVALSILKVADKHDIVDQYGSWFFKLFVEEVSKWCWRSHEIVRLENAVYAFACELVDKGLMEE